MRRATAFAALCPLLGACAETIPVLLPDVSQASFVQGVDNPLFPLPVGATWRFQAVTDEGTEQIDVEVLTETREIQGVTAVVVRDTVTLDGEITEDTHDWYAQDSEGNVWYLGEDTCEYEGGECVSTAGAWEWGVDGALPGVVMWADPQVDGQPYYQEFSEGEAEDAGEVVETGVSITVAVGSFDGCIRTHDTSTLDRHLDEHKTYCPDVGVVLTEEPEADEELIASSLVGEAR